MFFFNGKNPDKEGDLQSYMISTVCKKMIGQIVCESVGQPYLLFKLTKFWAGAGVLSFQMLPFSLGCSCSYSDGMVSVKYSVLTTNTYYTIDSCRGPVVIPETLSLIIFPSITLEL